MVEDDSHRLQGTSSASSRIALNEVRPIWPYQALAPRWNPRLPPVRSVSGLCRLMIFFWIGGFGECAAGSAGTEKTLEGVGIPSGLGEGKVAAAFVLGLVIGAAA